MNFSPAELEALSREIACRMDPEALLDAADVGAILKYRPRYVTDHLMGSKGFPKEIRLPAPGGGKGHPRWRRRDILEYLSMQGGSPGTRRAGRPRRRVD